MANRLLNAERYKILNGLLGTVGQRSEEPYGIREALELLIQTRDVEGTRLLAGGWTTVLASTAAPALISSAATVPEGRIWLVHCATASHSDTGVSHDMGIALSNGTVHPMVEFQEGADPNARVALRRNIYVTAGYDLEAVTAVALTVGFLNLQVVYTEFAEGDYAIIP